MVAEQGAAEAGLCLRMLTGQEFETAIEGVHRAKCGERLIRTDMCATRSSRRVATPRPPGAC